MKGHEWVTKQFGEDTFSIANQFTGCYMIVHEWNNINPGHAFTELLDNLSLFSSSPCVYQPTAPMKVRVIPLEWVVQKLMWAHWHQGLPGVIRDSVWKPHLCPKDWKEGPVVKKKERRFRMRTAVLKCIAQGIRGPTGEMLDECQGTPYCGMYYICRAHQVQHCAACYSSSKSFIGQWRCVQDNKYQIWSVFQGAVNGMLRTDSMKVSR